MIIVTGATGQLGRLVINKLLQAVSADAIVAAVRNPDKATDLATQGIVVRIADYDEPATLSSAFAGGEKLLLISANEVGKRARQHQAVIDAAKSAGIKQIVYTSLLHADNSPLGLANEHVQTEEALLRSGLPYVILRNGWYTENYTASIPAALEQGVFIGSAGEGRISSASRADFAAAAANVLVEDGHKNQVYELAGDRAYTLSELAAEASRQAGKEIPYKDVPPKAYHEALVEAGLPASIADMLADSDAGAAEDALFDDGRQLSRLIGRPTTPLRDEVARARAI
jgi:NAD(P)H dehydrogenase (quinone)